MWVTLAPRQEFSGEFLILSSTQIRDCARRVGGFGNPLMRAIMGQLEGQISREWKREDLCICRVIPLRVLI